MMIRSVRACAVFVLLIFVALFASRSVAQASPHPDADERVYPAPFLPDDAPRSPAPPQARAAAVQDLPWSRLVYYARGQGNYDLFYAAHNGLNPIRLTAEKAAEIEPDLNRGGTHVVFASDADGDFDLYVMRLADRAVVKLLDTPEDERTPVWSPDGSRVAYQSIVDKQPEIFVVDAGGQNPRRLTHNPDFDGYPAWSPDGARLAFSSRRNGQYRIWVMDAAGGGQTQLSQQPGGLYPAWSPDGSRIAYSADGNGDGWLDLWFMSADGQSQNSLRRSGGEADLMARSWTPDGEAVGYTFIRYLLYQQQWYINYTSLGGIRVDTLSDDNIYTEIKYPFAPAWQTLDTRPPVSAVVPLPAVSPGPIPLRWEVADAGGAGIRQFVIQVKTGDGPWADWRTNPGGTTAAFDAMGGQTYAFRTWAIDRAFNAEVWPAAPEALTTVEALPPVTSLDPVAAFSPLDEAITLTRRGFDPGRSGIANYLLQWRRNGGAWADWPREWVVDRTVFDPAAWGIAPGDTVDFRLRGVDAAHNVEAWPGEPGDASTTFYSRAVTGRVLDNTGTPVGNAAMTADPALAGAPLSGPDGDYARFLTAPAAPLTLVWAKPGYGGLPATTFAATTRDVGLDVVLPPADDALAGGDFEAAGWGAWVAAGSPAPALSAEAAHTGAQGALLAPRPPRFAPAQLASNTPSITASDVHLGVRDGAATIVWLEDTSGNDHGPLRVARRGPDGVMSPPATLLPQAYYGFKTVSDGDGLLHIVARTENNVIYRQQTGDTTWAAPETLPSPPMLISELVHGPDGALHLLMQSFPGSGSYQLTYSRRAPSGGWSAPVVIAERDRSNLYHVGAAVAPDGGLHVVYLESNYEDADGDQLWARERRPNGTWTAPALLHQAGRAEISSDQPPVIDRSGRVHVLWNLNTYTIFNSRTDVYYAVKQGASWSSKQRLFADAGIGVHALAIGPDDVVHALLIGRDNAVRYVTREVDGVWRVRELVPSQPGGWLRLLIDTQGLPHVIRGGEDGTYNTGNLEYTRRLPSGGWTAAMPVSTDFDRNYQPDAQLDAGGNVHVAWLVEDADTFETRPDVAYAGPAPGSAGQATLSQTVAVPAVAHPALSFFYDFGGGSSAATRFEVKVGSNAPQSLPASGGSRHHWLDLSAYAGQSLDVTFRLVQAAGEAAAWAAVDDVSLGAAVGDVRVAGASAAGLPGETVVIELRADNRGGVAAENVALTYALPPEMTFVAADPPPSDSGPLRWSLGTLAPGATRTIRLTAAVKSTAKPFTTVTGTAAVAFPGELETHNNTAVVPTPLERTAVLPLAIGP